ncbi:MAG: hypothetical protein HYV09_01625 [Deltaproteobacteria bacterium]|nr:hypothetical protein [Deltaproteobacteria bacterium]
MRRALLVALPFALFACSSESPSDPPPAEAKVVFELDADFADEARFWDFPYPSDLRLRDGAPIGGAFPNPLGKKLVENMRQAASGRKGFPVVPTGYFRFDAALAGRSPIDVVAADARSPVLLIDVDPASPDRGKLFPVVAGVLASDDYVPENVLGVAPRPGFVLHGGRKYAYVVRRSLGDAKGKPLGVSAPFAAVASGNAPPSGRGAEAKALYAPLLETLSKLGVATTDVAAATVFTTGDVVADFGAMSDKVLAAHTAKIESLAVDPDDGAAHARYCELKGTITFPQFQKGKPPFDSEGLFELEGSVPKKQRDETVPFTLSLPKQAMPAGGWPLVLYFHGSGGLSTASADRGRWVLETDPTRCPEGKLGEWEKKTGCNTKGEGPAHVVAAHGLAMAGTALPVNPERLPGASEIAYINLANLSMMRDLFRQGAIEQRLFLAALLKYEIAPAAVAACSGLSLPSGATAHTFRAEPVLAMGQSMGGMYTNIIGAIEPKIRAVAPTGAGGFWSYFITKTSLYDDGAGLVAGLVSAGPGLDFLHPVLTTLETAVEAADPMVYMPRLARRPLDKHPTRAIYEPVGKGDSYFPIELYDAIALAYGHKQAGEVVWPSMQEALKLASLDGLLSYPLTDNLKSEAGTPYTGAVIQYAGDGLYDPHAIYTQLDAVQYQYGCFFSSFVSRGVATIPAPAALGTACP